MFVFSKFSNFMSWGGAFDSLFCPEGRVFVHSDCLGGEGGEFLLPSSHVPGKAWLWMKLIPALRPVFGFVLEALTHFSTYMLYGLSYPLDQNQL